MTSPKAPRKTVRVRALEACRNAMTLHSELTAAIAKAELLQHGEAEDRQEEARLDTARLAATTQFTHMVSTAGREPAGTVEDLETWKSICAALETAKGEVDTAMAFIQS